MSANPWGIPPAPMTPPDCSTCDDSGEVGDGRTREHDTGMWVTAPCPACTLYATRKSA